VLQKPVGEDMNLRLGHAFHTTDRSHTELNDVSSLNGYDHTRHNLYLNCGGNGDHYANQWCRPMLLHSECHRYKMWATLRLMPKFNICKTFKSL